MYWFYNNEHFCKKRILQVCWTEVQLSKLELPKKASLKCIQYWERTTFFRLMRFLRAPLWLVLLYALSNASVKRVHEDSDEGEKAGRENWKEGRGTEPQQNSSICLYNHRCRFIVKSVKYQVIVYTDQQQNYDIL